MIHRSIGITPIVFTLLTMTTSLIGQSIEDVNVFIGTQNMGHTYPGATAPFGMVQLSPDSKQEPYAIDGQYNAETYRYCAGYQYDDSTIFGFSHSHFSGTGHADLGDFLMLPVIAGESLLPGDGIKRQTGYYDSYDKASEKASPGYYHVQLNRSKTEVELTASTRVGLHRYHFPAAQNAAFLLDLASSIYGYEGKVVWSSLRVENDTLITGYRQTRGWARDRKVFFAASLSHPITNYRHDIVDEVPYKGFYRRFNEGANFPEMAGQTIRAEFEFGPLDEPLVVAFALSGVSTAGALANLKQEAGDMDFDRVRQVTESQWQKALNVIEGDFLSSADQQTFATAMYHSMLSPIVFEDVDGSYRGLDGNIHLSEGFVNYSIFSLWDTYRALHPWFNLMHVDRNRDMIQSMLAHADQSVHEVLPVWSHWANENWCMIGYHAVSVLADARAKGMSGIDWNRAIDASIRSSTWSDYDGLGEYLSKGYVTSEHGSASISKTLEYAYDDWCIAQLIATDVPSHYQYTGTDHPLLSLQKGYEDRSMHYKNSFNPKTGWATQRHQNGTFHQDNDLLSTHGQGFIEGNAWNYSFYAPHDVEGLKTAMGGEEIFVQRLDSLFTMDLPDEYIAHTEDITRDGIMGNYVHGNEPSHHVPYLYNWTDQPWKTQHRVRSILQEMYGPGVDGLCGNDDAGQMSAWYLFSSLGFYPVTPGSSTYAIGSPNLHKAILHLSNGQDLHIVTKGNSQAHVYVKSVLFNGQPLSEPFIEHWQLMQGGTLTFIMSRRPVKQLDPNP